MLDRAAVGTGKIEGSILADASAKTSDEAVLQRGCLTEAASFITKKDK